MIRKLIILLLIVGCEKDTTSPKPEDCAGVAGGNAYLDECGFCVLYGTPTDHVCPKCGDGYVLLWGECYPVEWATNLFLQANQLTGDIPPEIGNLTNLTNLILDHNQLTGEIPQEVCDLMESNILSISNITSGNNITKTCV